MLRAGWALAFATFVGCGRHDVRSIERYPQPARCPVCSAPEVAGALLDPAMDETSGLVASLAHPGVFYAHNDSGDTPRFFAMTLAGARLATFDVANAEAVDWEDIARGPCGPDDRATCIYLADIGDNHSSRATYAVYKVREPEVIRSAAVNAEVVRFRYPDGGSHDAESLLVDPQTATVVVVTKEPGRSAAYEIPKRTGGVARKIVDVNPPSGSPRWTSGDVAPSRRAVLLRSYTDVFLFRVEPGEPVARALARRPCMLVAPDEPQGESVAWLPGETGYALVSEGLGATTYRVRCEGLP